jgi:hypothetical protein
MGNRDLQPTPPPGIEEAGSGSHLFADLEGLDAT